MDGYTFLQELAKDSYGRLVAAKDIMGKNVTIKIITVRSVVEWHGKKNGRKIPMEVYILHRMRGTDGIPQLVKYFSDGQFYYIVLEEMKGVKNLLKLVSERGPLTEAAAKEMFTQLVGALHSLWMAGFVHGDINIANVFVNPLSMKTYLVNFGLSSLRTNEPLMHAQQPMYAAPETLAGNVCIVEEAEVWALGVLLYDVVSETCLFENEEEILLKRIPHPKQQVSRKMRRLLLQLLNRKPLTRINLDQVLCSEWLLPCK